MFTVEYEHDAILINTLDETDSFEDVEMVLADDMTVYIRQWNEGTGDFELLYLSYQQLLDILAAMQSTEGAYYIKLEGTKGDSK